MFSKFKKKKNEQLFSPMSGSLISLSKVKDPVFSQGMMGPGFGIEPKSNEIYSPVEGTITNVFPTKHAIGIKTYAGKEILLHIGIETVELKGEGFEVLVDENTKVTKDTLLVRVDRLFLKSKEKDDTLILVFPEEKTLPDIEEKLVNEGEFLINLN